MSKKIPHPLLYLCLWFLFGWQRNVWAQPSRTAQLAASCMACHTQKADSITLMPSLNHRSASLTRQILINYRKDKRRGIIMNQLSKGLSIQQIEKLSIYFSEIPDGNPSSKNKHDTP